MKSYSTSIIVMSSLLFSFSPCAAFSDWFYESEECKIFKGALPADKQINNNRELLSAENGQRLLTTYQENLEKEVAADCKTLQEAWEKLEKERTKTSQEIQDLWLVILEKCSQSHDTSDCKKAIQDHEDLERKIKRLDLSADEKALLHRIPALSEKLALIRARQKQGAQRISEFQQLMQDHSLPSGAKPVLRKSE